MEGSRIDARTVALALLCLAVLAFAAATLDTTTEPDADLGFGSGPGDESGDAGTPAADETGASDEGRPALIDLEGGTINVCVKWLTRPLAKAGLLLGLVGLFFVGRWYDDRLFGLALVFIVGYPGFFSYVLVTSCQTGSPGLVPDLSRLGSAVREESGGLIGGQGSVTAPSVVTQLLVVVVVVLLGAVAVVLLTGEHRQSEATAAQDQAEPDVSTEQRTDVAAIGAAAGQAADRIERDGAFENEVYRAWAAMTDFLSVDHPESSTPGEFAEAAVAAGMERDDVDRLTALFATVRYGGADPTPERERTAVETLRHIEQTYADGGDDA